MKDVQYQRWLNSVATREVFERLEAAARPVQLTQGLTGQDASYTLGFITGYWAALDAARSLVAEAPEEVLATYGGE